MTDKEKVDFCFLKETKPITHIDHEALRKCELRPQEAHIQVKDGKLSIIREHKSQDKLRNEFLISCFQLSGLDLLGLDCEFIFNSGDDVDFYEDGVPRWCFTRRAHHPNLLIPNSHIYNVRQVTQSFPSTDMDFEEKLDKAIFVGSYTGGHLPKDNQRFLFCIKNKDSQLGKFRISTDLGAFLDPERLKDFDWKAIQSEFIPYAEQLKYKYIFNINGNTNAWDRLPWAMNSNSLCLFLRPKREDMCWHYHYYKTFGGFVYVDETDWEASVEFFNKNPSIAKELSLFQQKQSSTFVSLESHAAYFGKILKFYNDLYGQKN